MRWQHLQPMPAMDQRGGRKILLLFWLYDCTQHVLQGSQLPLIQYCLCIIFVDVTHLMEVPSFVNLATPICHLSKKETSPTSYTKSEDFLFLSRKFSIYFMFDKEHQELISRNHFSLANLKFIKKLKTNKSLVLSPYLHRAGSFFAPGSHHVGPPSIGFPSNQKSKPISRMITFSSDIIMAACFCIKRKQWLVIFWK